MRIATLVLWPTAAILGAYLLTMWLANGGLQRGGPSRFAPALIFGHGGLALTGFGVWVAFLVADVTALAWASVAVVLTAAALGATMFGLWVRAGHVHTRGRHAQVPRHAAEDHFPPPAVLAHGLVAASTVVLVLLVVVRL